jgi:hypothetical protein
LVQLWSPPTKVCSRWQRRASSLRWTRPSEA